MRQRSDGFLEERLAGTRSLELAGVAYGEQDARRATLAIVSEFRRRPEFAQAAQSAAINTCIDRR